MENNLLFLANMILYSSQKIYLNKSIPIQSLSGSALIISHLVGG